MRGTRGKRFRKYRRLISQIESMELREEPGERPGKTVRRGELTLDRAEARFLAWVLRRVSGATEPNSGLPEVTGGGNGGGPELFEPKPCQVCLGMGNCEELSGTCRMERGDPK